MSDRDFLKTECRHCAGHFEFPADGLGQTIPCPHCGQPTKLAVPAGPNPGNPDKRSRIIGLGIAVFVILLLAGLVLFLAKARHPPEAIVGGTASSSNAPVLHAVPIIAVDPNIQAETNEFAILRFKLEQKDGSTLVYVIGTIRNQADRQRFGVKVQFGLFDANDNAIGTATDYQSVLEPRAEWRFKAMVMESQAVSARFQSITEDQ